MSCSLPFIIPIFQGRQNVSEPSKKKLLFGFNRMCWRTIWITHVAVLSIWKSLVCWIPQYFTVVITQQYIRHQLLLLVKKYLWDYGSVLSVDFRSSFSISVGNRRWGWEKTSGTRTETTCDKDVDHAMFSLQDIKNSNITLRLPKLWYKKEN